MACVALVSLAACTPTAQDARDVDALSEITCTTRPGACAYFTPPVRVRNAPVDLPRRPYRFFPLAETLTFSDARQRRWVAPSGTLTDGASIPPIFVSIVGSPAAPEYVSAGAIHDAYCGVGNEAGANYHAARWQDVHRMFYDALVAGGTPDARAQLMFSAVWLGGPRWNTHLDIDQIPDGAKRAALGKVRDYIDGQAPSFSQLMRKLQQVERTMLRQYPDRHARPVPGDDNDDIVTEEGYYEGEEESYEGVEYDDTEAPDVTPEEEDTPVREQARVAREDTAL
ncbi:hypothetical protein Salmuc_02804 [Salipiger mucosus DSM 16094]|uniref:DUF1353 domain-containing protein n=2 Tax=Salipiger mucosus TaxID=263378 RepID=S9R0F8_9RHOB|nr:hypothetical protein Salmuc_02804 [Salipiger mucosus DSM 16094]